MNLLRRKAIVCSHQVEIDRLKKQLKERDELIKKLSFDILELQVRVNELEEMRKKYIQEVQILVKEGTNKKKGISDV